MIGLGDTGLLGGDAPAHPGSLRGVHLLGRALESTTELENWGSGLGLGQFEEREVGIWLRVGVGVGFGLG